MKAKCILLGAALTLTAALTQAQTPVYSVNVVGYHKVVFPAGQYRLIANQVEGTNVSVSALFSNPPEGLTVSKFIGAGYSTAVFEDGAWGGANLSLAPGEGAFVRSPFSTFTNVFAGQVILASSNSVPTGYSIRSSVLPQQGTLQTALNFPIQEGDVIFKFTGSGYMTFPFEDGAWGAAGQPTIGVGESFFVFNANAPKSWQRTFVIQ